MIIKINPVSVAQTLAEQRVKDELLVTGISGDFIDEDDLYEPSMEVQTYTPEAQECYGRWYDYYFEILTNSQKHEDGPTGY